MARSAEIKTRSSEQAILRMPPRPRVCVLGSGWGSFAFAKSLSPALFDITIVSPRNHMLFTVSCLVRRGTVALCVSDGGHLCACVCEAPASNSYTSFTACCMRTRRSLRSGSAIWCCSPCSPPPPSGRSTSGPSQSRCGQTSHTRHLNRGSVAPLTGRRERLTLSCTRRQCVEARRTTSCSMAARGATFCSTMHASSASVLETTHSISQVCGVRRCGVGMAAHNRRCTVSTMPAGVQEHVMFLKELADARAIRTALLRNVESASFPSTSPGTCVRYWRSM